MRPQINVNVHSGTDRDPLQPPWGMWIFSEEQQRASNPVAWLSLAPCHQHLSCSTRRADAPLFALPRQLQPAQSGTRCSKHTSVYKVFMDNGPESAPRQATDPDQGKGRLLVLALVSLWHGGAFAAVSLLQRKGHPSCWPAWRLLRDVAAASRPLCSREPSARLRQGLCFLPGSFSGHFHAC